MTMSKTLASKKITELPYGERDGDLIHISTVERGLGCKCICPVCKSPLIARKGAVRKHHFSHSVDSNCNPETVLHDLGKKILHSRISSAIADGISVDIKWNCSLCQDTHSGNLIKRSTQANLEMSLENCRPDITLCDGTGAPVALVEIVVSHPPEDNVRSYAATNNLPIVEFHLSSLEDLERLKDSNPLNPSKVDLCTRPKCRKCGKPLFQISFYVVTGPCWKCHRDMKVALFSFGHGIEGPDDVPDEALNIARQHGVVLQVNFSKTMQERYVSNTCPRCRAFVGNFYLHDYFEFIDHDKKINAGLACLNCKPSH